MTHFHYTETQRTELALDTALYRLGRLLLATDDDRALIAAESARQGKAAVRERLHEITELEMWHTGDVVVCENSGEKGVVREINCEGPYWQQVMDAADGGTVEEIFTPAYSVIVEFPSGRAFCHRQSLAAG